MAVQKYDIRRPESEGGGFEERYWSPINSPVLGAKGEVAYIIHRVEDVTQFVRLKQAGGEQHRITEELRTRAEEMEAENFRRAQQVQEINNQLQAELVARKPMEDAIRQSEERFRLLVASVKDYAILMLDTNGHLVSWNAGAERIKGYQAGEIIGQHFSRFYTPEDIHGGKPEHELKVATTEGRFEDESWRVRKDGTRFWANVIITPIRDEAGTLRGFSKVTRDVTERKQVEEELSKQTSILKSVLNSMGEGVVVADVDGKFLIWNPAAERLVGYGQLNVPKEEWSKQYGVFLSDQVTPYPPDQLPLAKAMRGEPVDGDEQFLRNAHVPHGIWLSVTGRPLQEAGIQRGGVVVFRDITERKRAEEALRHMQTELAHANRVATMGQLSASIAHEVNQPITAAVTYALAARRWLSVAPPNFREVDDALSLIVKEGTRAGEVVGRIRALIKKMPARKDAVAINDAILEVIALTRTEAANNTVSVRTQLAEGLPRVQGDRVQLQQVLLNLTINAIEAMRDVGEEERELLISTRNERDGVSVEVRDSGPGFAPEALKHVFEAFYTTKPSGLGLGLSICRSIIEAHNGRLWASANLPRGASFHFALPAIANTAS
jgi:PAS domain S-box-containing protein